MHFQPAHAITPDMVEIEQILTKDGELIGMD
jgi:hypothetical protein